MDTNNRAGLWSGQKFSLRRWCWVALLLPNAYLPFYLALGAEEGGWLTALTALRWVSFSVLYWIPTAYIVFCTAGSRAQRWLSGFALSVPLYFLCLWLVYPLAGTTFHPATTKIWGIYLLVTVPCFLLVVGLAALTSYRPWSRRAVFTLAVLCLAIGIAWPLSLIFGTDQYRWPTSQDSWNLTGGHLVELPSGKILSGKNIHVKHGRISQIIDAETDTSSLPRIDLGGAYVLPGLIDVHTHLAAPVRSVLSGFDFGFLLEEEFSHYADHRRAYLESGVTAVRDCGGPAVKLFHWREQIADHRLLGPELFAVGRLVTAPHGHPVETIWKAFPYLSRQGAILAGNQSELITGLRKNLKEGPPDAIKFIDGTIGQAPEILNPTLMAAGILWARQHHFITVVHTETAGEIKDAVQDAATGVEHVATAGVLPASLIAQMVQAHTFADPTFGEYAATLQLEHVPAGQRTARLQSSYAAVRQLAEAGVPLTIGTDAPLVAYGSGFLDELDDFKAAGFSPLQILTFATKNNAAYLEKSSLLGCIDAGCKGDLLVTAANPLTDLPTLRKPLMIFRDGVLVIGKRP